MKKFAMVKPSRSEPSALSEDATTASSGSKGPNKYAEEVLKDALKKRFNEKFQLSNPKANKLKAKSPLDAPDPPKKKLESSDLSEAQLEGLTKKFNQKIYISIGERVALATELGMTEQQVQVWFSTRRTKLKKNQELAELITTDPKAVSKSKAPPQRKAKGPPKSTASQPKSKDFQLDALSKVANNEKKVKNPEVIDILDDEEELSKDLINEQAVKVEEIPSVIKPVSKKSRSGKHQKMESIDEEVECEKGQSKNFDQKDEGKDKEIEVLRQEIKIILNDMVKKSVMEKEIEAWRMKCDSITKAFKEKEQVVKNLEVKIPNMIEEFTKCVENKEYLFDLKEKELKKAEAALVEKDAELKNGKLDISKLTHELDQWKNEKNDFVVKVANLDVKVSKLSNELFKKEMEIKKLKEREKESLAKMKQLAQDLELKQAESATQNQSFAEMSRLKARSENQAATIQTLNKTSDYQKSQIAYFMKEVEDKAELINKKEVELNQLKENASKLSAIQFNVSQLSSKCDNQNKIIENQKTIISKFKIQSDDQAKQISKLAELQDKVNENNDLRNSLKQSLEKKSGQVKNLKNTIEIKNSEMSKAKSVQDQMFSQINELEMKNFNKSEEIKTMEAKYKTAVAAEKKSVKTVSIQEATKEYMKIVKENQKNKKVTGKIHKDVEIITLDEQTVRDTDAPIPEKLLVKDIIVPENSPDVVKECLEVEKGEDKITIDDSPEKETVLLKFNFGEEAVPYASEHKVQKKNEGSRGGLSPVFDVNEAAVSEDSLIAATRNKLLPMLTYHWPLVTTQPEHVHTASGADSKTRPVVERKLSRKLVKRAGVDMSQGRKERLAVKSVLMTDSVIPAKRRRMFSELHKYNCFLASRDLLLPVTPQLSSWEKLMMMKLVLNSSVFSNPDLKVPELSSKLAPSQPTLSIAYNWPVMLYQPCTSGSCPPAASTDRAHKNSLNLLHPLSNLPSSVADKKMTRKLVKRGDVDLSRDERKARLAVKRSLIMDSGIPSKRRRLSLITFKCDILLSPSNLPVPLQPSCWERLTKMRLVMGSSVVVNPNPQDPKACVQLPQNQPLPRIAYNWPIMPYKQRLVVNAELLPVSSLSGSPLSSLVQSCKAGQKRRAGAQSGIEGTSKRLRVETSTPVWPVVLYKPCPATGHLVDRSPAIRGRVSDTQDVWMGRKRPRCWDEPVKTSQPKRSKPNPSSSCWPIAILPTASKMPNSTTNNPYAQISSVTLHFNLPTFNPSSHLPPPAVIWPLAPFKECVSVKSSHPLSPEVSGVQLLFPTSTSPPISLQYQPPCTSWPLVPFQPVSEGRKRQRTLGAPEPSSKKRKLSGGAETALPGNDEMCSELVLDVLDSVSVKSLLRQVMKSNMKKIRVSLENRPQLNQLFKKP